MFVHHSTLLATGRNDNFDDHDTVDTKGAALVLGVSESWLNKLRKNPADSPRFLKLGKRAFYKFRDLRAWQDARLVGGNSTAR